MRAFVKILKKFEKVSGKQVLSVYLRAVESSYFNSSGEALKLMDEVEDVFVRHFAAGNRRKAMKYLKPTQRKESHTVTFFIGKPKTRICMQFPLCNDNLCTTLNVCICRAHDGMLRGAVLGLLHHGAHRRNVHAAARLHLHGDRLPCFQVHACRLCIF